MNADVQSERLLSVMHACGWKVDLTTANVVSISHSNLGRQDASEGPVWGGGTDSPEEIAWAVEDIQRLLLPQLDHLHTAQDLWQRLGQPEEDFPGFSSVESLREWLTNHPHKVVDFGDQLYAARCLPDETYAPLLQLWEETLRLRPDNLPNINSLKFAAALRQLPQTPMDAPL